MAGAREADFFGFAVRPAFESTYRPIRLADYLRRCAPVRIAADFGGAVIIRKHIFINDTKFRTYQGAFHAKAFFFDSVETYIIVNCQLSIVNRVLEENIPPGSPCGIRLGGARGKTTFFEPFEIKTVDSSTFSCRDVGALGFDLLQGLACAAHFVFVVPPGVPVEHLDDGEVVVHDSV